MFKKPIRISVAFCVLAFCASTALAQVRATYLYTLSNFGGPLRENWGRIYVDREKDETYLVYPNLVRIFSSSGMELFSFGDDLPLGHILDVSVEQNGEIIVLSFKDGHAIVTRCNFRGEPIAAQEIKNLPADVTFAANRMVSRGGLFYFVSLSAASVIITDSSFEFRKKIDFLPLMEEADRQKEGAEIFGFSVDADGNILFTIPVLFKAFKYSPAGQLTSFGRPGNTPGKFGIVAGIDSDSQGHVLVADKLRSVVMVFDKNFAFLSEFGYRGTRPSNLVIPDQIALDGKDRLYVTQGLRRGVSVFALATN